MDQPKFIGSIYSVAPGSVSVVLRDNALAEDTTTSTAYRTGKLGSYVIMPEGDITVIGTVTSIRNVDITIPTHQLAVDRVNRQVMDVQLIGLLRNGRFERGVTSAPILDGSVYAADAMDIRMIFSAYREHDFSIGTISNLDNERLFLDPNKFFAKHIALFGSTGSGKSCTTASIIQKIDKLVNTHVILLDLHGEYEPAFRDSGNIIRITELELPYWLMNFEELVETFIDENESSANNQMMVMKEAVLDSKRGKNMALKDYLTIDSPLYFDFLDVSARMRSLDTERTLGGKEGPFYGQFTRFLVRLESKLTDRRYEFMFRPKTYRSSDTLVDLLTKLFSLDSGKRVTVIDLSRVPFDVINVLVSLLGRIIFDFNLWNKTRQDFPILIVFEEAHTYLSMTGRSKAARKTVERVAKEGRKYGVSCMIVSQRPAEISETITSQCNNFVAMRLLNPNDQTYVRKLVPDSFSNFIDILPTLQQGEAFIIGDAVAIPTRVLFDMPSPTPSSGDIRFYEKWKRGGEATNVSEVVNNWWKQIRTFK
jgi:DNA helicase HerA-like ATPase